MVENTLLHCTVVENCLGDPTIDLFEEILEACSLTFTNSNLHNLLMFVHFSRLGAPRQVSYLLTTEESHTIGKLSIELDKGPLDKYESYEFLFSSFFVTEY